MTSNRPIAYLDVDDTILRHPPGEPSAGAPGAAEFLRFLARHFEVRWLTRWCPGGRMTVEQLAGLETLLDVPAAELERIVNPCTFEDNAPPKGFPVKWRALDWAAIEAGRPFVWIENHITAEDRRVLEERDLLECFVHCDVTANPHRLAEVRRLLERRFGLTRAAARKRPGR